MRLPVRPLLRPVRSEGFAIRRDPLRVPPPEVPARAPAVPFARRRPPAPSPPCSWRLAVVLAACAGAATSAAVIERRRGRRPRRPDRHPHRPRPRPRPRARHRPRRSRLTVTDDEGTALTLASAPQKIVSLTPAVTETLFARRCRGPGRRHGRLQRLPGRGEAPARCRDLRDRRRRKDRQPRPRPGHRRWRRLHLRRIDRPAARGEDPGSCRLERDARPDRVGHRADRDRARGERRRRRPWWTPCRPT